MDSRSPLTPKSWPRSSPCGLFEHDGAGTVTEEDGGTPIGPVDDGRHGVAPDDEHAIGPARRGHHSVGGHIAVREAGTHDVEVHPPHVMPKPAATMALEAGNVFSGVVVHNTRKPMSPA